MEQRVTNVYDSVIFKHKSDRNLKERIIDQELSKALGVSISSATKWNDSEKGRKERSPLWKLIPRVERSDNAPLVLYLNDDLQYMLYGPKECQPSTKEVATYEEIPELFLEEVRFADIFSEEEVSREKYNIDAYLGIINVNERSRGFYKLRQLKRKPQEECNTPNFR